MSNKAKENTSVHLLDGERQILARIAVTDDRSLGDTIRRLAVTGLRVHNPEAAERMEKLRREHREQILFHLEENA